MNRRGSLMKLTPALKSWPMPPMPVTCHEKSSRNCHFFCSVVCGVFGLWPDGDAVREQLVRVAGCRAVMLLAKSAYWKMNSFSFVPPITQLWLTLIELNSFLLSPQLLGARLLRGAVGLRVLVAAVAHRQVAGRR